MGWWMALNLRKSLSKSTELYVYDINSSASERLREKAATDGMGPVNICSSCREVAAYSVSIHMFLLETQLRYL
jgi:3-hydroxyisobutyrate/3-hydroxypropionate dehydrogenase